jgi:NAD(P)-dependent dehydrogenase (short-subunit alcohol dehydrogenase family)
MSASYENTLFDLRGRSALVTGGSRGLGREIAGILAQAGAAVMICGRTESSLKEAADEIGHDTGSRVEFSVADMGRRPEAERMAEASMRQLGKVDILFSNAGWNVPQAAEVIRDEDWDALLELNVTSSMVLTRALAPGMMERQWGRIIYTSSIMALGSTPERVAYSATKSALIGMVKANALRMGPHGVTVNALAPGPFATEMPMTILTPEQKAALAARTAVGRWGQPSELAGAALLLASAAGSYITGSVMVIDGGAMARIF